MTEEELKTLKRYKNKLENGSLELFMRYLDEDEINMIFFHMMSFAKEYADQVSQQAALEAFKQYQSFCLKELNNMAPSDEMIEKFIEQEYEPNK